MKNAVDKATLSPHIKYSFGNCVISEMQQQSCVMWVAKSIFIYSVKCIVILTLILM